MKKFRIPLIIAIFVFSAFLLRGKIPHEKFDSELWKTANLNSENNLSLRWDMMNDLRNKHKLDKLSQEETLSF